MISTFTTSTPLPLVHSVIFHPNLKNLPCSHRFWISPCTKKEHLGILPLGWGKSQSKTPKILNVTQCSIWDGLRVNKDACYFNRDVFIKCTKYYFHYLPLPSLHFLEFVQLPLLSNGFSRNASFWDGIFNALLPHQGHWEELSCTSLMHTKSEEHLTQHSCSLAFSSSRSVANNTRCSRSPLLKTSHWNKSAEGEQLVLFKHGVSIDQNTYLFRWHVTFQCWDTTLLLCSS